MSRRSDADFFLFGAELNVEDRRAFERREASTTVKKVIEQGAWAIVCEKTLVEADWTRSIQILKRDALDGPFEQDANKELNRLKGKWRGDSDPTEFYSWHTSLIVLSESEFVQMAFCYSSEHYFVPLRKVSPGEWLSFLARLLKRPRYFAGHGNEIRSDSSLDRRLVL